MNDVIRNLIDEVIHKKEDFDKLYKDDVRYDKQEQSLNWKSYERMEILPVLAKIQKMGYVGETESRVELRQKRLEAMRLQQS